MPERIPPTPKGRFPNRPQKADYGRRLVLLPSLCYDEAGDRNGEQIARQKSLAIVEAVMQNVPAHLHVKIDRYVIMPNHVHLIAVITEEDILRAIHESPLQSRTILSKLIGYIKMNTSKMIRQHYGEVTIWQRGYHDHVIRNQEDYVALAEYIQTNPLRWELDKLYSEE